MMPKSMRRSLFTLIISLFLSACLGQAQLPGIETVRAPTIEPPKVDPTIAAVQRLSLTIAGGQLPSSQSIPQINHDLIGRSDCLMCHKQGVSDAPRIPDSHLGLESNTCQTCHVAPASAELSGPELYLRICARCHGENGEGRFGPAINFKPYLSQISDTEIREAIIRGRGVSEMLSWGELGLLTDRQIDELVSMIRSWESTAPETSTGSPFDTVSASLGDPEEGETVFAQFCSGCHGLNGEAAAGEGFILFDAVGLIDDEALSRQIRGGSEEMPPFHSLLTTEDINNLLALMRLWHAGPSSMATPIVLSGEEVFARVCARCHGSNGEGGIGGPLNSKEFLSANDNHAIRQWIFRGTLGTSMLSWGDLGLLSSQQIDELVDFIRAWEPSAPSTVDADSTADPANSDLGDASHGEQLFAQFCSGCHGLNGERPTANIILNSQEFLDSFNDEILASQIQSGGIEMPSFHTILTSQDVNDLLAYMRSGFSSEPMAQVAPSFANDVLPIFMEYCAICHGSAGNWDSTSYEAVMTSGDHTPVVVQGDPDHSSLAQRILGTQTVGGLMPPAGRIPEGMIDVILNWIMAGALDN